MSEAESKLIDLASAAAGMLRRKCERRPAAEPRYQLSLGQAAAHFGRSRGWVREQVRRGELEGFAVSRTDLSVSIESIIRWEDRHRISAGQMPDVD